MSARLIDVNGFGSSPREVAAVDGVVVVAGPGGDAGELGDVRVEPGTEREGLRPWCRPLACPASRGLLGGGRGVVAQDGGERFGVGFAGEGPGGLGCFAVGSGGDAEADAVGADLGGGDSPHGFPRLAVVGDRRSSGEGDPEVAAVFRAYRIRRARRAVREGRRGPLARCGASPTLVVARAHGFGHGSSTHRSQPGPRAPVPAELGQRGHWAPLGCSAHRRRNLSSRFGGSRSRTLPGAPPGRPLADVGADRRRAVMDG